MPKYTQTTQTPWTQSVDQLTQTISTILDAQNQRKKQEAADARQKRLDDIAEADAVLKWHNAHGTYESAKAAYDKYKNLGIDIPAPDANAEQDMYSSLIPQKPKTVPVDPSRGYAPGAEEIAPGQVPQPTMSQLMQSKTKGGIPAHIAFEQAKEDIAQQKLLQPKTKTLHGTEWIPTEDAKFMQHWNIYNDGTREQVGPKIPMKAWEKKHASSKDTEFTKEKHYTDLLQNGIKLQADVAKFKAGLASADMLKEYNVTDQRLAAKLAEEALKRHNMVIKQAYPQKYKEYEAMIGSVPPPVDETTGMPDPVANKGKFMVDKATNSRFQSNGVTWVPVK